MAGVTAPARPEPPAIASSGCVSLIRPPAATRRPPRLRTGTLWRERLLRRLAQTRNVPLSLVVAPAGYGKTTLLVHWLGRDRRPVAWISIDDSHNDPDRLLTAVAQAMDGADLSRGARQSPFVLVLDDLHRLRSDAAHDVVRVIADAVPPESQLVLASRAEPALPLGRLRANGRLTDVRARDLAMTRREAAAMLRLAGLDLRQEDVLTLLRRTEGWPAALYLAAVSLKDKPDQHRGVARFAGDDRLVADYLRDEVLDLVEEHQRVFMRRTSVLDQLSGPLCDAVLETTACGGALHDLSRSNVPIVALDGADDSYRYHPLLVHMLRAELRRAEPELEAELHRRASDFYADAGDADRAIEHAIAGGDLQRAGELLWSSAADHILNGRNAAVRRWLDRFAPDQVASHPTLALTAAASHLVVGERDLAEHWAAAADRGLDETRSRQDEASVTLMRAAVARDGIGRMGQDARRAYEGLAEDSPWRSLCRLLSGVDKHLRGSPEAARPELEDGARRGAIAGPAIQVLCLAQLALIALDEGDWAEGQLLAARARAQVERVGLVDYPPCALVFAVSAFVRAHRDRVDDAQADRRRATDLLTKLVDYVPWYDIETRIVLARAALRLGDVTGTRTLLGEASRLLGRAEDALALRAWTDSLLSQTEAFAVTELVGPSSLTTAELRVLTLLPTHQSFREIGNRLHVSANTVKTHAHAVYRKLDVCSRSEAVLRACEIGLLDAVA